MKFDSNEDFTKNIGKLLALLQQMLKEQKIDNKELNKFFGKKNVNVNLCFFTFMPFSLDEWQGMEELMDEDMEGAGFPASESLTFELNKDDKDFLKKHGIKF
jgi:hypothetical protein